MSINPDKAKFYTTILFNTLLNKKHSYDKVFSDIVRRYKLTPREASLYYKLFYKLVVYYHTIRFLSSYNGFGHSVSGIVEYLFSRAFDLDRILDEARELSHSLSPILKLSILYGYPSWFIRDLYGKLPSNELESMLKSLNEKKRWLRVNTLKTTIEDAVECLEKTSIRVKRHEYYEDVLLVEDPFVKIGVNECISKGYVIPQDITSYTAISLVTSQIEDFVDACSAPGVKLIQVYSQLNPRRLVSVDIDFDRLTTTRKLVSKFTSRDYNVIYVNADSAFLQLNLPNSFILVDAPCSNTGAIYGDPTVKLYITKKKIQKLSILQKRILVNALRNGRKIYYMTCSIHPLEGEEVVDYVVRRLGLRVKFGEIPINDFIDRGYQGYTSSNYTRRIYPHRIKGQGFFLALLEVEKHGL